MITILCISILVLWWALEVNLHEDPEEREEWYRDPDDEEDD
jgi:nitrogen fixation-related uncharacterized protein